MKLTHLVFDLSKVHQSLKAVSKSFGNKESPSIFHAQLKGKVLKIGRGIRAQIDHHIMKRAPHSANKLRFAHRRMLEMHPPQGPCLCIGRKVALHDSGIESVFSELRRAKCAREKAPLVWMRLEINDKRSRQRCFSELHVATQGRTGPRPHSSKKNPDRSVRSATDTQAVSNA